MRARGQTAITTEWRRFWFVSYAFNEKNGLCVCVRTVL